MLNLTKVDMAIKAYSEAQTAINCAVYMNKQLLPYRWRGRQLRVGLLKSSCPGWYFFVLYAGDRMVYMDTEATLQDFQRGVEHILVEFAGYGRVTKEAK